MFILLFFGFTLCCVVMCLALRGAFLMECLADLRKNLMKRGVNLLIRSGKPEDILPSLAKDFGAHTVKSFFYLLVMRHVC